MRFVLSFFYVATGATLPAASFDASSRKETARSASHGPHSTRREREEAPAAVPTGVLATTDAPRAVVVDVAGGAELTTAAPDAVVVDVAGGAELTTAAPDAALPTLAPGAELLTTAETTTTPGDGPWFSELEAAASPATAKASSREEAEEELATDAAAVLAASLAETQQPHPLAETGPGALPLQTDVQSSLASADRVPQQPSNDTKTNVSRVESRGSWLEQHADDVEGTLTIPKYVYQLPLQIDFLKKGDGYRIRVAERYTLDFALPWYLPYTYVPVAFAVFFALWKCCCGHHSSKDSLGLSVVCETMACFMCMWARKVTDLKLLSSRRAWGWVLCLAALVSAWHIADAVLRARKASDAQLSLCFYGFQGAFLLVWCFFALDRMHARKMIRRAADPLVDDAQCGDCAVELCCPQLSALQEAQFAGASNLDFGAAAKGGRQTGGQRKW